MTIRLIALDLDGTLLTSGKTISPGDRAAVEAAAAKADAELRELKRKAEEKYQSEAGEQAEVLEGRKAALRAQAEEKLAGAAALIVERIVNN